MSRHDTCPECPGGPIHVTDTRQSAVGRWRRRRCAACGHRWSTLEITMTDGKRGAVVATLRRALRDLDAAASTIRPLVAAINEQLPETSMETRPE